MLRFPRQSLTTFAVAALWLLGQSHGVSAQAGAVGPEAAVTASVDSSRIVSIGGDVTEILYALGLEKRIVAVDSTSQFPPRALKDKKNVGYMRALSSEGVLSVGATVAIASEQAGPAEVVKALRSAMPYVEIPQGLSADGVPAKIKAVAAAVGLRREGDVLADKVSAELAELAAERAKLQRPLRALFVLSVQSGRVIVGGSGTSADTILQLAGLRNAASGLSGFKPVSDEALLAMQPDLLVAMKAGGSDHNVEQALRLPGLANSPAARDSRLIVMDGLLLLGLGPRTASAARDLMHAAYTPPSATSNDQ